MNKEKNVLNNVKKRITKYVEKSIYYLNPDDIVVKNIFLGLARNELKHGYAYCPCKSITNFYEQDKLHICPCREHKNEITRTNSCECGLIVNKKYINNKIRRD